MFDIRMIARSGSLFLLTLVLAACASTGRKAELPPLELPMQQGSAGSQEDISRWWLRFDDPMLTTLIERAFAHNTNLKAAAGRVDESAALLGLSRSYLFPTVDASLGASRNRATELGSIPRPSTAPQITNSFSAGLNVSYELDLWGRIRSANDAAAARYLATREAQNGLRSSLAAQVAQTWFNLQALDRKLVLTRNTLTTRDEALRVQQRLFEVGSIGPLVLRQAEAERESVAALIPRLVAAQASSERALAVLTGASPRAIVEGGLTRSDATMELPVPPQVPAGLSSELLTRRPDVREAEASLSAAQASVKEARTAYFPSISLTGSLGRESTDLSDLFSGPAGVWRLAGALAQPIFGGGRIDAQVDAAKARRAQAEANYVGVVQSAFREVYDSLGNLGASSETLQAQERQVSALRETLRVAQRRYDAGLTAYIEVLDAQRNLLNAETATIDTRNERLSSTVNVFRSMGGGWETLAEAR